MPDKEGSDDEKTTKGVVKKKTKQMLNQEYIPEEGDEYDAYRDNILMRGGDHRSKETRERSYTPTGKQPKGDTPMQKEFKKKYGKKATALDAVKQKYKDQMMNVGKKSKKKANVQDEFDLTKIAEAFGGYIIEAKSGRKPKDYLTGRVPLQKNTNTQTKTSDSKNKDDVEDTIRGRKRISLTGFIPKRERGETPDAQSIVDKDAADAKNILTTGLRDDDPKSPTFGQTLLKNPDEDEGVQSQKDDAFKKTPEYQQSKKTGQEITAGGGLAKEKQYSLDTRTQAEFEKDEAERARKRTTGKGDGRKAGRTPEERKTGQVTYKSFVNKPEVTGGQDRATDTRSSVYIPQPETEPKKPRTIPFKEPKEYSPETQRQINRIKRNIEKREKENPDRRTKKYKEAQTQTQADGGGKVPPGRARVTTSGGGESGGANSIVGMARKALKNPALTFLTFDTLRKYLPSASPFGIKGGRVGSRSAPS